MWEQNVRIGEMNLWISLDIFGDSQINRVFLVSNMGIRDIFLIGMDHPGFNCMIFLYHGRVTECLHVYPHMLHVICSTHDWPFVVVNRDKYTIYMKHRSIWDIQTSLPLIPDVCLLCNLILRFTNNHCSNIQQLVYPFLDQISSKTGLLQPTVGQW